MRLPAEVGAWVEARRRFRLSHAHVQMARELGMNPTKLGKIANADQEPWKLSLPLFIEQLYLERFGKHRPDEVLSVEEPAGVGVDGAEREVVAGVWLVVGSLATSPPLCLS